MTEHIDRDTLLGVMYGLLDETEATQAGQHLQKCETCATAFAQLQKGEMQLIEKSVSPPILLPASYDSRWQSPMVPVLIILAGIAVTTVAPVPISQLQLAPLFAAAAGVAFWLYRIMTTAEKQWRDITREKIAQSLPQNDEERGLFLQGLQIAARETIHGVRKKISIVNTFGVFLGFAGAIGVAMGQLAAPEITAQVTQVWPNLLLAALTISLLFGAAVMASWRLQRLGYRVLESLMITAPSPSQ